MYNYCIVEVRGGQLGLGLRVFRPRQGPGGLQAFVPCQGPGLYGSGLQAVRPCQGPPACVGGECALYMTRLPPVIHTQPTIRQTPPLPRAPSPPCHCPTPRSGSCQYKQLAVVVVVVCLLVVPAIHNKLGDMNEYRDC